MAKKIERKPTTDETDFKNKFYHLMFELDLYNKFKKTYKLNILKNTNYGYYAHLYLSSGLSFTELQHKKIILEQNLCCLWIMKIEPFKTYAEVQIVINPIDKELEFENPKIKPYELYLGNSFSNKIQKNNNNDNNMFLLSGATGSGKTRYMYQVLLSWIMGCKPSELWIYLADVAKNEYIQFKNVRHVKYYASETNELYLMMQEINREFNRRKKSIEKARERGTATNIFEYNKIYKTKKLSYAYVVIDELSVLLPDKTDNKIEAEEKEYIMDVLKRISKMGRSLGIFSFISTQKTTRDEMPSILKNMSAVRISFRANDTVSSEVIMGDGCAMGLSDRVAVYSLNGGSIQHYLYTPKITIEMLKELLKDYSKSSKELNFVPMINVKVTSIPKGANIREYMKPKKKYKINKGEYNDY